MLGISNISYDGCHYITFRLDQGSEEEMLEKMKNDVMKNGICCEELVFSGETPIMDKFDPYIPTPLLQKAYATDRLRADEAERRILNLK